MVGSGTGGDSRSKEAVGMMALHEALRNVCLNSDWTYSVFWTIRPRPYFVYLSLSLSPVSFLLHLRIPLKVHFFPFSLFSRCRGGNGCKVGDDNGSLMLMWEDGFCRTRMTDCLEEIDGEDPVRKAFSKMSIQLYNYGEGLMGKVASDKCHKWVFKEPSECEPNISNYWQSSFDALPPEWTDQFASGIQTIAVIQAGHGLLQLGSCKIIPEDLHFVLRMRHMFESLGYQSGFFLSQLFSSTRNTTPSPSTPPLKQTPSRPPQTIFNWSHPLFPNAAPASHSFHPSSRVTLPTSNKDDTHLFLLPHSDEDMIANHEADLKWPNGLSFFNALTGRTDDAKLLFGADGLGSKPSLHHHQQQQFMMAGKNVSAEEAKAEVSGSGGAEEYLSLESHSGKARKVEGSKFKRSFTLPARMSSSSSSGTQGMEYRSSEAGIYSDIMETFLE